MPITNLPSQTVTELTLEGMKKDEPIVIAGTVRNQYAVDGHWLRGTLHSHIDRPGRHSAMEAADHYRANGYDFIIGMEKHRVVDLASRKDLIVLPGAELVTPAHILAYGITAIPDFEQDSDIITGATSAIEAVKKQGGITVLAHPFESAYTWEQLTAMCAAGLDGIEVINSAGRGKNSDTGRSDQLWHNLMREGWLLLAAGGDDTHRLQPDLAETTSHTAWTGVLVEEFSEVGLLEALRAGRTYASEGPEFYGIECHADGRLVIRSSACSACHIRSVGGGKAKGGGGSGATSYPLNGADSAQEFIFDLTHLGPRVTDHIVIILQDSYGRRAWSSPIEAKFTTAPA